ncbi:MAG: AsmA family protein [Alistipes sp.]|nr:AsmA family protein [Alistipes sp.]
MKTVLKVAGAVIALLLAVVIIVPIALKPKIGEIVKKEANEMLNARLDFNKLDLSLLRHFPHASVELKGLTLVGVERFEGDTIVAADRISVVVNLGSLFSDDGYEVTKILLDRPYVSGRKLADGAVNWDIMKVSGEEEEVGEDVEEESDEPSSFRLQVKDFSISNAEIRYADDSTKLYFVTRPFDLRLRGDMSAAQTDLDLWFKSGGMEFAMDGAKFLNKAEMELTSVIAADLENGHYTLSHNTLRLNAIELSLDGWVETGEEALSMDLAMNSSKVKFKDILSMIPAFYTKDFKDLTASGELTLGAWVRGEMKGDLLPAFNLSLDVANGSFKYADLPRSVDNINVAASVSNNGGTIDATKVDVPKLTLTMAGNSLSASFGAATPVSDLQFRAAAKGKVDLGAIKDVYPLDEGMSLQGVVTADMSVAGRMSDVEKERYESIDASGTLTVEGVTAHLENLPEVQVSKMTATVSPKSLALKEMNVNVGSSDLSADGTLSNYIGWFLRDDVLSGTLNVRSKLLDVNELLSALPADEEGVEVEETESEPMSAIEVPKNLKLSLAVDLNRILFQQMTLDKFTGRMGVADGKVSIDKLGVKAFGGEVSGSGAYSTAADPKSPKLNLSLAIDKAKFEETFKQLDVIKQIAPIFAKTGGDYSMNFTMDTSLTSDMGVEYNTLNGSGTIRSENIDIQNIEAFEMLAKALNNDKLRKISAKDVKIAFAIKNGRVNTSPFDIKMGDIKMTLSGSTGLDQSIDYTGNVSLPAKTTNGMLSNVNLKIGGTFSSPKVTVDVKEAAKEVVTNVVNEQLQKLTGSEDLSEEFEKQAAKLREEADKAGQKLVDEAKKQRENLVGKATNALTKLAAEKSGDALVSAAEKQAANLKSEAEKQIEELRKKMFSE